MANEPTVLCEAAEEAAPHWTNVACACCSDADAMDAPQQSTQRREADAEQTARRALAPGAATSVADAPRERQAVALSATKFDMHQHCATGDEEALEVRVRANLACGVRRATILALRLATDGRAEVGRRNDWLLAAAWRHRRMIVPFVTVIEDDDGAAGMGEEYVATFGAALVASSSSVGRAPSFGRLTTTCIRRPCAGSITWPSRAACPSWLTCGSAARTRRAIPWPTL
eukprot:6591975-Prymnesium_polylepis.2